MSIKAVYTKFTMPHFVRNRLVSGESLKSHRSRIDSGFMHRYLNGDQILEIGGTGDGKGVPITDSAINIDLGYPGYDGRTLPFADGSQDAVYTSHCLEHIDDFRNVLQDWFRVLKVGGYLIVIVPHQLLCEKKVTQPSRFAGHQHKRFYLPSTLLNEIQTSLPLTEWRLRHMRENDDDFDYDIPPHIHSIGSYEIECVIQKIPQYKYLNEMLSE
jgi:SAM-dependent methyltransferase